MHNSMGVLISSQSYLASFGLYSREDKLNTEQVRQLAIQIHKISSSCACEHLTPLHDKRRQRAA